MSYSNKADLMDLAFKSIIDAIPCYIMIQDQDFKILFANHKTKCDFGDDIIGVSCYSVLKSSPEQCKICPVRKTFKDKKIHINEQTIHLSDGTVLEIIAYSAPLFDALGNVKACIKLLVNVGTMKESHRELATLGQSIALLSHDIKNIIECLQGGVYAVDEGIREKNLELSTRGWDIVKKNITEISAITQNILYSAKKRNPKRKMVSPVDTARHAGCLFSEKASSMKIQLQLQLNPDMPQVEVDPMGISRMLGNLIWNSLQACQEDKEKSSHTVHVRVDYYDKNHFMYEVEDNASGMDKETQENLFKKFFSSKGDSGTGLGLIVVQKIVQNHHGKIEVLTKPGKGTLFRVIFRFNS